MTEIGRVHAGIENRTSGTEPVTRPPIGFSLNDIFGVSSGKAKPSVSDLRTLPGEPAAASVEPDWHNDVLFTGTPGPENGPAEYEALHHSTGLTFPFEGHDVHFRNSQLRGDAGFDKAVFLEVDDIGAALEANGEIRFDVTHSVPEQTKFREELEIRVYRRPSEDGNPANDRILVETRDQLGRIQGSELIDFPENGPWRHAVVVAEDLPPTAYDIDVRPWNNPRATAPDRGVTVTTPAAGETMVQNQVSTAEFKLRLEYGSPPPPLFVNKSMTQGAAAIVNPSSANGDMLQRYDFGWGDDGHSLNVIISDGIRGDGNPNLVNDWDWEPRESRVLDVASDGTFTLMVPFRTTYVGDGAGVNIGLYDLQTLSLLGHSVHRSQNE